MEKLFKEPLLQFFVLGALIFAVNAWRKNARLTEVSAAGWTTSRGEWRGTH